MELFYKSTLEQFYKESGYIKINIRVTYKQNYVPYSVLNTYYM